MVVTDSGTVDGIAVVDGVTIDSGDVGSGCVVDGRGGGGVGGGRGSERDHGIGAADEVRRYLVFPVTIVVQDVIHVSTLSCSTHMDLKDRGIEEEKLGKRKKKMTWCISQHPSTHSTSHTLSITPG